MTHKAYKTSNAVSLSEVDSGEFEFDLDQLDARPGEAPLRVLFVTDRVDAPYRYRAMHNCLQLRADGVCSNVCFLTPETPRLVQHYSVVVLFRLPWSNLVQSVVDAARACRAAVVFDIDDLIFDPKVIRMLPFWETVAWRDRGVYIDLANRLATTFEHADFFIGATERLVSEARVRGKEAAVHPNLLHPRIANHGKLISKLRPALLKRPIISYMSGSATHDMDFLKIAPRLRRVMNRHPDARLLVCGFINLGPLFPSGDAQVIRLPYLDWQILPWVQSLAWLNLAPIAALGSFSHSKSALKFFEAAAVGVPTAASPIESMVASIDNGVDGFLCQTGSDWENAMEHCLNRDRSFRVGRAALARVKEHTFRSYRGTLKSTLSGLVSPNWSGIERKPRAVPVAPEQIDPALNGSLRQRAKQGLNRFRSIVGTVRKYSQPERLGMPFLSQGLGRDDYSQRTFMDVRVDAIPSTVTSMTVPPIRLETIGKDGDWQIAWQIGVPEQSDGTWISLGNDPCVLSPEIDIRPSQYPFVLVELTASCSSGSSTAQIYWLTPEEQLYSEERSFSFAIVADGRPHTYLVDTRRFKSSLTKGKSKWIETSLVTRLRFDPLQHSGEFRWGSIRLLGEDVFNIENWQRLGLPDRADQLANSYLFGEGAFFGPPRMRPKLPACADTVPSNELPEADFYVFTSEPRDRQAIEADALAAASLVRPGGILFAILEIESESSSWLLPLNGAFTLVESETQPLDRGARQIQIWRR